MRSVESRKSRSKWTCARLTQAQQVKRQIKSARIIIGNSEDKRCEYTTFLGDQRAHITGIMQLLPPRAPQMPHVAQYTFLFRTNASAVLPSLPYIQSRLSANGSILPNDRHKDRTFPPSGSTFSPPSWRCLPQLRDCLSKLPNFFRKTGRNPPKVPHFLFHHSRYKFETAKKNRKYPTNT